jgi:hypothetical protein
MLEVNPSMEVTSFIPESYCFRYRIGAHSSHLRSRFFDRRGDNIFYGSIWRYDSIGVYL